MFLWSFAYAHSLDTHFPSKCQGKILWNLISGSNWCHGGVSGEACDKNSPAEVLICFLCSNGTLGSVSQSVFFQPFCISIIWVVCQEFQFPELWFSVSRLGHPKWLLCIPSLVISLLERGELTIPYPQSWNIERTENFENWELFITHFGSKPDPWSAMKLCMILLHCT